jgi:hypothetical protein
MLVQSARCSVLHGAKWGVKFECQSRDIGSTGWSSLRSESGRDRGENYSPRLAQIAITLVPRSPWEILIGPVCVHSSAVRTEWEGEAPRPDSAQSELTRQQYRSARHESVAAIGVAGAAVKLAVRVICNRLLRVGVSGRGECALHTVPGYTQALKI